MNEAPAVALRSLIEKFLAEASELDKAARDQLDPDLAKEAKQVRALARRLEEIAEERS